jgi:hypothetical protein
LIQTPYRQNGKKIDAPGVRSRRAGGRSVHPAQDAAVARASRRVAPLVVATLANVLGAGDAEGVARQPAIDVGDADHQRYWCRFALLHDVSPY